MRASSSSSEMASARISCSLRAVISVVIRFEYYIRLTQDGSEQVDPKPVHESFVRSEVLV
jgi:hypothetical protein